MRVKFLLIIFLAVVHGSYGQQAADSSGLLNLSFEELMNVTIVSASKKAEDIYISPLSASVLTRKAIEKAGCTSIMDAFRLMPGLIVREQSNGNFDIHLRGMNGVNRTGTYASTTNLTTLVMIDNRPVYSYLNGGTFWETLPIDINDVERIEVIRGPASALYGPNAVSGVINIITRRPDKNGLYAVANTQAGSYHTQIANASIGYKFNRKIDMIVSGNLQDRQRTQTSYYETLRNTWIDNPQDLLNSAGFPEEHLAQKFADPKLAMKKYGLNTFINYSPSKKIQFHAAAGLQDSKVQNVYYESQSTPLTTSASNSRYVDLKANADNVTSQVSYASGTYTAQVGGVGQLYDFTNIDATLEYNFQIKNLSLKPGVNIRKSTADDTKYVKALEGDPSFLGNGFSGLNAITTRAAFLRADYKILHDKVRLVGGARVDRFNHPSDPYLSYQFSGTYNINSKNLVRLVYGRANQSPLITKSYINQVVYRLPAVFNDQVIPGNFVDIQVFGNTSLKMQSTDMVELGYRSKLGNNIQLDVELFTAKERNYSGVVASKEYMQIKGAQDTAYVIPLEFRNTTLKARETGATVSVSYTKKNFQIQPFVTAQTTTLYDFSDFDNTADIMGSPFFDPKVNNMFSGMGSKMKHVGTPSLYGGANINFQPNPKWNINLNSYFYTSHTFYMRIYTEFRDGIRGIDHLNGKLLLNAKLSYSPVKTLTLFATVKNLTNNQSREFYKSDRMGFFILGGLNFRLKD